MVFVKRKRIIINTDVCWGCGNCVQACPFNPEHRKVPLMWMKRAPILRLVNGVSRVVSDACYELLPRCRICEEACPSGALKVIKVEEETLPV
ncbi:MAG: ATP-binding protein [Candidatus Freyarchaeota archaeon]|nr:4Fe-4S binding protein [Candidatus Freyrarchaeum guaymaensis]